jgi:hypothetical protein
MPLRHAFVPRVPFEDPGEPRRMVHWQNAQRCGRWMNRTGTQAAETASGLGFMPES